MSCLLLVPVILPSFGKLLESSILFVDPFKVEAETSMGSKGTVNLERLREGLRKAFASGP